MPVWDKPNYCFPYAQLLKLPNKNWKSYITCMVSLPKSTVNNNEKQQQQTNKQKREL
jgi:hypothetical protein